MTTATCTGSPGAAAASPVRIAVTAPSGCVTRCGRPNSGTSTPPPVSSPPARAAQAAASAAAHSPRAFASASANLRSGGSVTSSLRDRGPERGSGAFAVTSPVDPEVPDPARPRSAPPPSEGNGDVRLAPPAE